MAIDEASSCCGSDPNSVVIEPEARGVVTSFDEYVAHYELVHGV